MNASTPLATHTVALTFALFVSHTVLPAQPPPEAQVVARVHEYMSRLAANGYTGGVLVVRGGRTIVKRSYGMANASARIPADSATVYNLGSITKQFTAAAILRLEEQGKLRTTDSIGRFFPAAPADKRGITLHQLLTHTAGFDSDYSPTDYEPTTRDIYVARMFAATLRTTPGTTYFYANSGYSLLAAIVELVTGQEYEQALRDLVLRPAGMLETGYTAPQWAPTRIAHGYQDGRDWGTIVERIAKPGAPYWSLRGNGGLHTTLSDMARWDVALSGRGVFADSSRTKFMTGYVNEGLEGRSKYAYGWAVMQTARGTRLVSHNGGNGVYVAELLRFVDEGVTIFVTSTRSEQTATPVVGVLSRIAFGQAYTLPPARVAASPAALKAAAGVYAMADGSRLTLRVRDDRLFADAVGQQAFQLLASGDTVSPPMAAQLNERSRVIVAALVAGDIGPLRVAVGASGPDSTQMATQEAELMQGRRERFGAYLSMEVLGSVAGPIGDVRTTVRLNFANGAATNLYTWGRDGTIMDVGARPYASVELLPADDGGFVSDDQRTERGVRLTFSPAGATARTSSGTVTLRRVVLPK